MYVRDQGFTLKLYTGQNLLVIVAVMSDYVIKVVSAW